METPYFDPDEFVADCENYVDVCVGAVQMQLLDGRYILEEDYRVKGEVWRVHKSDADPYQSNPHAHCVGGANRFVRLTLHLGTAELYDGRKAIVRRLEASQFSRLIQLIQPKFPHIKSKFPHIKLPLA